MILERPSQAQRLAPGCLAYLERRTLPERLAPGFHCERERRCAGVSISLWRLGEPASPDAAS